MATNQWARAGEILPASLIAQIQKHYDGGALWIPTLVTRAEKKHRALMAAYAEGTAIPLIARELHLSQRWVREIIRAETGASAQDDPRKRRVRENR